MAHLPLQVEIFLDHIHCYDEGDGIGSAEPYLWTIYFKIDGDTVSMGDDQFLHGTATVVTTPGSHGNLGDTDVDEDDDVPVPAALGEFTTTLMPIPIAQSVKDQFGIDDVGGIVGVAVVLMEEDWVTDAGAEAGHQALNQFVEQAINNVIPTLGISNPTVSDDDIKALTKTASDAASDAVSAAQSTWHNVTSWLNGDDQIGSKVFTFSADDFGADAFEAFSERWDNEGDWELFGQASGVPTCPAVAIATVLESQKLLDKAQVRSVMDAARAFRQRTFAGRPALGAWWNLVERNAASIARILHDHPELSKKVGGRAVLELTSAIGAGGTLTEGSLQPVSTLLETFAEKGPRRLRLDAKAALGVLPALQGKTVGDAVQLLTKQSPTRKPRRPARNR